MNALIDVSRYDDRRNLVLRWTHALKRIWVVRKNSNERLRIDRILVPQSKLKLKSAIVP